MTARPSAFPDWALSDSTSATSGQPNVSQPAAAYQNYGYDYGEHPTRQYENWQGRTTGNWIRHLDASLYESVTGMRCARHASNTISVSPGKARGIGGNADTIVLPAVLRKTNATWAAGDNAGGVPVALHPMVDGTWYHVFVVKRDSGGIVDAGFDTDIDAANLLAGFSGSVQYRRVGSVYRTAGAFRPFMHDLNSGWFRHDPGILAASGAGVAPGLHIVSIATGVPPGIPFLNEVNLSIFGNVTAFVAVISDRELSTNADYGHLTSAAAGVLQNLSCLLVTDATQQVSLSVNAPTTTVDYEIMSCGYQDLRHISPDTWM